MDGSLAKDERTKVITNTDRERFMEVKYKTRTDRRLRQIESRLDDIEKQLAEHPRDGAS